MIKVECKECKSPFETHKCWIKKGRGVFCSRSCSGKWNMRNGLKDKLKHAIQSKIETGNIVLGRKKNGYDKNCIICDAKFYVSKSQSSTKYCSLSCSDSDRTGRNTTRGYKVEKISGPNHYNWKGQDIEDHVRFRDSKEYRDFRDQTKLEDKLTCKECGVVKKDKSEVQLHHIKSFMKYPELRMERSNVVTLCPKCHYKTDSYGKNISFKNMDNSIQRNRQIIKKFSTGSYTRAELSKIFKVSESTVWRALNKSHKF